MANFKAPQRGGNVVHRLDVPSMNSRRARRLIALRRAELAGLADRQADRAHPEGPAEPASESATAPHPAYVMPAQAAPAARRTDDGASAAGETLAGPAIRDDQARSQILLLERRLAKMSRLLDQRDQEIVSRSKNAEETGVASVYREVQGVDGDGKAGKQKLDLMSRILEANLKLRERVTSASRDAE